MTASTFQVSFPSETSRWSVFSGITLQEVSRTPSVIGTAEASQAFSVPEQSHRSNRSGSFAAVSSARAKAAQASSSASSSTSAFFMETPPFLIPGNPAVKRKPCG